MKRKGAKERILETVSRLFYYDGYNQTGINRILDEADVAKASMYHHFRSKEEIAVSYLKRQELSWLNRFESYMSTRNGLEEKLSGIFDFLALWLEEENYRGCAFQNIVTDLPSDQESISQTVKEHKTLLLDWLENLFATVGNKSAKDASNMAKEIMVLIEGAIIQTQIQKELWPVWAAKRVVLKIV